MTFSSSHVQATSLLSEIFPGSSPKIGPTYWDQIQEVAIISVIKRILQRLSSILDLVSFYFAWAHVTDRFTIEFIPLVCHHLFP
jgi:zinc finger FYVE domain-containing protein 26